MVIIVSIRLCVLVALRVLVGQNCDVVTASALARHNVTGAIYPGRGGDVVVTRVVTCDEHFGVCDGR
jgi:hypothetical protein